MEAEQGLITICPPGIFGEEKAYWCLAKKCAGPIPLCISGGTND